MYFQTLMEWKKINQTYSGGDVCSTKLSSEYFNFLPFLLNCRWSMASETKLLDAAPLWARPLLRNQLNHHYLKHFSCHQLPLPKKKQRILCPKLWFGYGGIYHIRLTTYSSLQGHYCASVKANSQHFWMRKNLFPVVLFWSVPTLRPFTLGCQNALQALITLTTPIWNRSAASPLFNQ